MTRGDKPRESQVTGARHGVTCTFLKLDLAELRHDCEYWEEEGRD